jgi:hypothetical protein
MSFILTFFLPKSQIKRKNDRHSSMAQNWAISNEIFKLKIVLQYVNQV